MSSKSLHRDNPSLRDLLLSSSPGIVSGSGVVRITGEGGLVHERFGAFLEPEASIESRSVDWGVLRFEKRMERAMRRGVLSPAALEGAIEEAAGRVEAGGRSSDELRSELGSWLEGLVDSGVVPWGEALGPMEPLESWVSRELDESFSGSGGAPSWRERVTEFVRRLCRMDLLDAPTVAEYFPELSGEPEGSGSGSGVTTPVAAERVAVSLLSPGIVRNTTTGMVIELQSSFYLDRLRGDDANPGTLAAPFRSFWPIRWWFALIELMTFYIRDWDFTAYRPTITLLGGGVWDLDFEWDVGRLGLGSSSTRPGFLPPVMGSLVPFLVPPSRETGPEDPTVSFPEGLLLCAWWLACKYMLGKAQALSWGRYGYLNWADETDPDKPGGYYGGGLEDIGPVFLKVPRNLRGFELCSERESVGSIRGCLRYDVHSVFPWFEENPCLYLAIGEIRDDAEGRFCQLRMVVEAYNAEVDRHNASLGEGETPKAHARLEDVLPYHTNMLGILCHENRDVHIHGVDFSGFHGGLYFLGACQNVYVHDCGFTRMYGRGITVSLSRGYDYGEWVLPPDQEDIGRDCLAWWQVNTARCPSDLRFYDNVFAHIGQNSGGVAIEAACCASYVSVFGNLFMECVDGVTCDGAGSGLHVYNNLFIMGRDSRDKVSGDGNGIDLKGTRPRTAATFDELLLDPVPVERWSLIHDNWFLGNLAGIIIHKGTSWVQIFNNHIVDNWKGIGIGPKVLSMVSMADFPEGEERVVASSPMDPPPRFESPLDAPEYAVAGDADSPTVLKTKHIYIYRNVIAANWSHGIEVEEGVTCLVCDMRSMESEGIRTYEESGTAVVKEGWTRRPYGMVVEDLVIVHNTIDSNGGCWMVTDRDDDAPKQRYCYGSGLVLQRCSESDGNNLDEGAWSAADLGDGFRRVAVYNNILSNNYTLQVDLQDSALCEDIFENIIDPLQPYNVIPRRVGGEPDGIEEFVYFGLDYNAYLFADAGGDGLWMRDLQIWTEVVLDGVVSWVEGSTVVDNDVRVSSPESDGTSSGRARRFMVGKRGEGRVDEDYALECNACIAEDYSDFFDVTAFPEILPFARDYQLADHIRSLRSFPEQVAWYLRLVHDEIQPWRTNPSSLVCGQGAHGPGTFPDDTAHAGSPLDAPIFESPDIDDQPVVDEPDIGAYECAP